LSSSKVEVLPGGGLYSRLIINAIALTAHHQPWQRVNAHIVNTGALEKFDVFWLPGGWSGDYWSRLSTQGMENLRQPVDVVASYAQTGELDRYSVWLYN